MLFRSIIHDQNAMIEDNDERLKAIEANSAVIASGVQLLLLFTAVLLLIFMGYQIQYQHSA